MESTIAARMVVPASSATGPAGLVVWAGRVAEVDDAASSLGVAGVGVAGVGFGFAAGGAAGVGSGAAGANAVSAGRSANGRVVSAGGNWRSRSVVSRAIAVSFELSREQAASPASAKTAKIRLHISSSGYSQNYQLQLGTVGRGNGGRNCQN
jgi:hypothetical protein